MGCVIAVRIFDPADYAMLREKLLEAGQVIDVAAVINAGINEND